jgi:acetolactate synthase-1/2/3 large subunit
MAWALHYFQARRPNGFFINMGFGCMGHGVAAAIGGKLAAPERAVISLTGDAAFAMNGMEVHTAVENDIPVIWVVMNNGGHGMVRMGEKVQFHNKFDTSSFHKPLSIFRMAESVGAAAYHAERPGEVERFLREALASKRPSVIEVMVDHDVTPPMGMRLQTLEKFFGNDVKPDDAPL